MAARLRAGGHDIVDFGAKTLVTTDDFRTS